MRHKLVFLFIIIVLFTSAYLMINEFLSFVQIPSQQQSEIDKLQQEQEKLNNKINILENELKQIKNNTEEINKFYQELDEKWNMETFEVTSYSPFDNVSGMCNNGNPQYTASGLPPGENKIAVDPEVIPLGTEVYVEEKGWVIAADTGGAIQGNIIDVYSDTYKEAIRFGKQERMVLYPKVGDL